MASEYLVHGIRSNRLALNEKGYVKHNNYGEFSSYKSWFSLSPTKGIVGNVMLSTKVRRLCGQCFAAILLFSYLTQIIMFNFLSALHIAHPSQTGSTFWGCGLQELIDRYGE